MNAEYLNGLREKYGYNDDLIKAIELTIPLMSERFGNESEVLKLFEDVRIFATSDMSKDNLDRIEKVMVGDRNKHLVTEEYDPYNDSRDPGSVYSYQIIYDEDMNPIDEERWIVVQDLAGSYRENGYRNLFGTSVNMPYFIHEAGHAYAMMHPDLVKDGDVISERHGMWAKKERIIPNGDGTYKVETVSDEGIILEEGLNELYTQDMLSKLLKLPEQEVKNELKKIGHVNTEYNSVIVMLCRRFDEFMGTEAVMDLRRNNNHRVIDRFNIEQDDSKIRQEYLPDEQPYSYFCNKLYDMFQLGLNKYSMKVEDYAEEQKRQMVDAFAPLMGYRETQIGEVAYDNYKSLRKNLIGEEKNETCEKHV